MHLLDGNFIEPTSPGGKVWKLMQDGKQIIALDAAMGQHALDLVDIAEQAQRTDDIGAWVGSLSFATNWGLPDDYSLEIGDMRNALCAVQETLVANDKSLPLFVDADACYGNPLRAFAMLNVLQVAAGVTENKSANVVKVNSLVSGEDQLSQMASVDDMLFRLVNAKSVQKNTLVGVRIENLIYGCSPEETVEYIEALNDTVDFILIHWNKSDPALVLETARRYKASSSVHRPLMAVTTSYGENTNPQELLDHGFQVLIYPNQVTRRNLGSAKEVFQKLLTDETAGGACNSMLPPTKDVIQRFARRNTFTYNRTL